ncbi:MAG: MBL fold metallo-hydrolase [Eubacterium sp.]|jgi:competence protein ComEC|nr:MBL fold metallo-hydrolase [Eubacterium sp.]
MARKSRGKNALKKIKDRFAAAVIGALVLMSLIITVNEKHLNIDAIPSWSDIFSRSWLSENKKIITDDGLIVHFIDVDQGDCQLIQTRKYSVLIDTGEEKYAERVINYLKAQDIDTLDYVILTHPHSDHIGGFGKIADEFRTENLIMPRINDEVVPTTSSFERVLDRIEKYSIEFSYSQEEQIIVLGETEIEFLAPVKDYDDLNNYSIVFKLTHADNSFLFTGDIENDAENDIYDTAADLRADVIKIAHHGSNGSSQKKILNAVGGKYAVIGVGSDNSYGHPGEKTLSNLRDLNYQTYRTDAHGSIVFISNGIDLKIMKERGAD